jgi:integrase
MDVKVRYVTKRVNKAGVVRWYWQRPGYKLARLPDNPSARTVAAERLNAEADGDREDLGPEHGSIAWVIARYKESDAYRDLAPGTTKYYDRYLNDIEAMAPDDPFSAWKRREVVDHIESYPKPHQRRQCRAVLKNLFSVARYDGIVTADETSGLRLKAGAPRERLWSADEIDAWLTAAECEDPHMTTAFMLLAYTAQRPSDVLGMTWDKMPGDVIRLRQQKTGKLLDVPCHPDLVAHLAAVKRAAAVIVAYRGRPVPYLRFNERFRRISLRAKVDAQARDLRRTGMVRMAEAGATAPQIASVSGHSIDTTARILETYIPRSVAQARAAIATLPGRSAR